MPGAVLHIRGAHFDPAMVLAAMGLTAYQTHNAGDAYTSGPKKGQPRPDGGLSLNISDADGDLNAEIDDAIQFLRQNREPLRMAISDKTVEDARIDFGYHLRIGDSCWAQYDYLPPELLKLAGDLNIGIELSLYPFDRE